jgi:hypothetical protein
MPHLRILPCARLCEDLARRNALQAFGYVPAEPILAATRGRRWATLWRSLSLSLSED